MDRANPNNSCEAAPNDWLIGPDATVLVTGAGGYVGSAVVRALLSQGVNNIRCLARSPSASGALAGIAAPFPKANLQIVIGNLLSPEACGRAAAGVSVIYHLAAGVEKSFAGCFLNSVVTTRNLLRAAVEAGTVRRFVNVSSIAVYGNYAIPRRGLLDESCTVDSAIRERFEPYTYGKIKQDEIVLEYAARHGLEYVIVRPGVVFGPGKRKISDRIGTSTFGVFLHLGLGNRIPLTFIENCADAIVLAGLTRGIGGQTFIITDDDLPTSRQFLRLYKKNVRRFFSIPVPYFMWHAFCSLWERYSRRSGGQLPPVFNSRTCSVYWKGNIYSNERSKSALNWRPKVSMMDALDRYFAYAKGAEVKRG